MTKVKCDVQILITGPTGSGKGLVMDRLREFLGNMVSNRVTQTDGFERQYADGCVFHVEGELMQNAGPKAPKDANVSVFINDAKGQPFKIVVDHITGNLLAHREGEPLHGADKVVMLVVHPDDPPTDPVGMDNLEAALASSLSSASQPGSTMARGGYVDRCALITPVPKDKSTLTRLEGESDAEYRNRNNIAGQCSIPPYIPVFTSKTESGAPEKDTHTKADASLAMLDCAIGKQFHMMIYEKGVYPGGLVAGNKVQLIFDDGAIVIGTVGEFSWHKGQATSDIVYWRRM